MMKLLLISCVCWVICSGILHVLALSGIVLGKDLPLQILSPFLFLNCGIAIFRGIKRQTEGLELTTLRLPRLRRLCYFAMIAYGFLFAVISSIDQGRVRHVFGDALTAKDAALFYSLLLCFFSVALLLLDEFSIEDNDKHKSESH